jgi:hypothetical protein
VRPFLYLGFYLILLAVWVYIVYRIFLFAVNLAANG